MNPAVMSSDRRRWRRSAAALCAVAGLAICGCGSAVASRPGPGPAAALPQLATSVSVAGGTSWAVVLMGSSAAQHDSFWQLFARPAGGSKWRQVTPAGVADNGGLVVGITGPSALVSGFRPSQDLVFSPLAVTANSGASWSAGHLVTSGLADVADALAADSAGQLIAVTSGGTAELGSHLGGAWTRLTSTPALARTLAGRACGLTRLTAAAFGAAAAVLLGGRCDRPGIAGIFTLRGGSWRPAGPVIPAALTSGAKRVEVLRLVTLGTQTEALLEAGTGSAATILAAWSADGGAHWQLSPPLRPATGQDQPAGGQAASAGQSGTGQSASTGQLASTGPAAGTVESASFGPGGTIGLILGGGRGEVLAGPGAPWRALSALPRWTAVLAAGSGGRLDALTAHGSTLADWRLQPGPGSAASWSQAQQLSITIPYGSSG
jgi:hypothetical protein